jgi:hypothetical protein
MQVRIQIVCNRVFVDLNHIVEILEQFRNASAIQPLSHPEQAFKIVERLDVKTAESPRRLPVRAARRKTERLPWWQA